MAARPQLHEEYQTEEVVRLAILAEELGIWALHNQAVDLLERQLSKNEWEWTPTAVDAIYSQVSEEQLLRRWVRSQMSAIKKQVELSGGTADEEQWKAVYLRHAALGWDTIQDQKRYGGRASARCSNSPDPCRYHTHPLAEHSAKQSWSLQSSCPY